MNPSSLTLRLKLLPGFTYALQTATNTAGPWWPIATNMAAANGALNFSDPNATNDIQF
jgi:hypothetical protein